MKKTYLIFPVVLMLFLASCSKESVTGPVQPARASVKIDIWKQPYLAYSYTYGDVEVDYTIRNICDEYISQYEINFHVTCDNGAVFDVKSGGIAVNVGESKSGQVLINTKGYKARSVELSTVKCW